MTVHLVYGLFLLQFVLGVSLFHPDYLYHSLFQTRQVGLAVGSWPSNRTNAGWPPSELDYTSRSYFSYFFFKIPTFLFRFSPHFQNAVNYC